MDEQFSKSPSEMPNKERTNVGVTLSPSKETCYSTWYDPWSWSRDEERQASLCPGKARDLADFPGSAQFCEVDTLSCFLLQMGKLRHREIQQLAQCHTTSK